MGKNVDERKLLNSWKEIAAYVGRGVRTVQRYELELGLPVRRPAGISRSSVMAFSDELDAWLTSAPVRADIAKVIEVSSGTQTLPTQNGGAMHNGHDGHDLCPRCLGTGRVSNAAPPSSRTAILFSSR
jgi:hypothetical protein